MKRKIHSYITIWHTRKEKSNENAIENKSDIQINENRLNIINYASASE